MLKIDPVETSPEYLKVIKEVEAKIIKEIGPNNGRGYCHKYWQVKKRILNTEYGIKWKSPQEMNPRVKFD